MRKLWALGTLVSLCHCGSRSNLEQLERVDTSQSHDGGGVLDAATDARAPVDARSPMDAAPEADSGMDADVPMDAGMPPVDAGPPARPPQLASWVTIITLDGLGSTQLEQALQQSLVPALEGLQAVSAFTLEARTDYTNTSTLPGHTSLLTGRPVAAVDGLPETTHHGYVGNGNPGSGNTLHNSGNPALDYVPSAFDVAHDNGFRTCLYAGKTKFSLFDESYDDLNGAEDITGQDDGRDKLDHFQVTDHDSETLVRGVMDDMESSLCDFSLVHIPDLDQEGHSIEWASPSWFMVLQVVDALVAELLDAIDGASEVRGPGAIVITADHGGVGDQHFDAADPSTYRIPLFVVSPEVEPGDLYDRVARENPGAERPSYTDMGQPLRLGDAGNLALEILGLPPVEGSLMRDLRIAP